jgi:hypothetical protein
MRLHLAALPLLLVDPAMAQAIVPDPTLTPGAVRTANVADICSHGTSGLSRERDDRIMAE